MDTEIDPKLPPWSTLVARVLKYLDHLMPPAPAPNTAAEVVDWRRRLAAAAEESVDGEDAWLELDRLADLDPRVAWVLLTTIAFLRPEDRHAKILAAGPLTTFFASHLEAYRDRARDEARGNAGFMRAYRAWAYDHGYDSI